MTGARTFLLPDLGEGLTEAEVIHWLVSEGDEVVIDQAVVEVETAKSLVEVPIPYAGRVSTLHASEGEVVEVGKALITIALDDAAASQTADAYREEEQAGSGNVLIGYGTAAPQGSGRKRRARGTSRPTEADGGAENRTGTRPALVISPLVRRLAKENKIDLGAVAPTGAGGVITRSDVVKAVDSGTRTQGTGSFGIETRLPLNGFRKAVSTALTRSRSEIPEATVWVDVDATLLWHLREEGRNDREAGPGLLAYLARFVVAGLREFPVLNSRLDVERSEIVQFEHVNLGVAVQGERGLVVPAVLGAESMTTLELDQEIRAVTNRAREGRSTADEQAAGTFTLNNYGGFGVDGSAAIINHPQVAMLGFGRLIDRPWVVEGEICIRKITQMSFVFDHRVCDGGTAAGFMRSVANAVENPASVISKW